MKSIAAISFFLLSAVSFCVSCASHPGRNSSCEGAGQEVSAEFLGIESVDAWGGGFEQKFAKMEILNTSRESFVIGSSESSYTLIHRANFELQALSPDGAWKNASFVFEDISSPKRVITIAPGKKEKVLVDVDDAYRNSARGVDSYYRVLFKDLRGCSFASNRFKF